MARMETGFLFMAKQSAEFISVRRGNHAIRQQLSAGNHRGWTQMNTDFDPTRHKIVADRFHPLQTFKSYRL
jgi:hypothetical protein